MIIANLLLVIWFKTHFHIYILQLYEENDNFCEVRFWGMSIFTNGVTATLIYVWQQWKRYIWNPRLKSFPLVYDIVCFEHWEHRRSWIYTFWGLPHIQKNGDSPLVRQIPNDSDANGLGIWQIRCPGVGQP